MIKVRPDDEIRKLYNTPVNRRLKYCALTAISISMVLMLIMIIWMDNISYTGFLFMRGCVGLGAIVFVILCACLIYRVNRDYINKRHNNYINRRHNKS